MISREAIMRELELLPSWRLRHTPNAVADSSPVESIAIESAVIETIELSTQDQALPQVTQRLSQVEEALVDKESKTQEESSSQAELSAEIALPLIEEKLTPARAELIQQMDWQALQDCVKDCQACNLATTRTQTVFGAGDQNAEWLFVGFAPGADDEASGEPFADQSGKLLDNMLAAMQLRRGQNVYLTNVLKCRSQESRDLPSEAVAQCALYLKQQVALMKPKLIIMLGESAAQALLQTDAAIDDMRGKLHGYQGVQVVVTYHPVELLSNPEHKPKAWDDLCLAQKTMLSL